MIFIIQIASTFLTTTKCFITIGVTKMKYIVRTHASKQPIKQRSVLEDLH